MPHSRVVFPALALLVAAIVATPTPGQAQNPERGTKRAAGAVVHRSLGPRLRSAPRPHAALLFFPATIVTESEPNDAVSQADVLTLGDTVGGTIDPAGDVDYYALDITAGTTVALDVIAERAGSPLDPVLILIGTDSSTVVASNDDFNGLDSYLEYTVSASGRYFVLLQGYDTLASPAYTYALSAAVLPPGPGDPTTSYATNLGAPYGAAAGATGELYVTDVDSFRLLRVAPNGQVTVLDSFPGAYPVGVAIDGFGDVLVSTVDTNFTAGQIVRFSGGQRSTFASNLLSGAAITIGPDADVWVVDPEAKLLRRYDPSGAPTGTVDLSSLNPLAYEGSLAFSPAGDLILTDGYDAIYEIVGGVPQLVYQGTNYLEGMAFDADGYLYVANGLLGHVILLDPNLQVVDDPFARSNLGGPTHLAFARDDAGAMTSRLLADNAGDNLPPAYLGGMVEMNPAGMRAVGFRIGVDLLRIATTTLKSGVVGADYADTLHLVTTPGPATWSLLSGALPPGLALSADGQLTGIPQQAGAFSFVVRVDAASQFGLRSYIVTVTNPTVSVDAASQHLLGAAPLESTLQRFLDLQGNKNGRFDVGDFRAFLRANGQLPATAVARREVR